MNQVARVLTAVDFSEPARVALEHALALSRRRDAELTVVHAVPADRAFRWRARERIALIGKLRQAAKAVGVRFRVSVQHGCRSQNRTAVRRSFMWFREYLSRALLDTGVT